MKKKREVRYSMKEIGKAWDEWARFLDWNYGGNAKLFRAALRAQKRKAKVRG